MHYEKISASVKSALPDKRLIKIDLTPEDLESLKKAGAIALAVIGAVGIATMAVVAPNLFTALHKMGKLVKDDRRLNHKQKQARVAQLFYYLKRTGKIDLYPSQNNLMVKLTPHGAETLEKLKYKLLKIKRSKIWDGKWWLIAADIPTKEYRAAADNFRKKIKQLGLFPLQRTLWIYPYNPCQEIEYTASLYGIGRFVTAMEISKLDSDDQKKLKEFFAPIL